MPALARYLPSLDSSIVSIGPVWPRSTIDVPVARSHHRTVRVVAAGRHVQPIRRDDDQLDILGVATQLVCEAAVAAMLAS